MRKYKWILLLAMTLGMGACRADLGYVEDNPVVTPDKPTPTEDQMTVRVTADLPTYVHATPDEGSTGAALVNRLPQASSGFGPDTRLMLFQGSDFDEGSTLTEDDIMKMARVYRNGGYIALERPTVMQFARFGLALLTGVTTITQDELEQNFGLSGDAAAAAARQTQTAERIRTRVENIGQIANGHDGLTRADDYQQDPNRVMGEMMIFSPTGYFMQQPFETNPKVISHTKDSQGNTTAPEITTVSVSRTPYISGRMADAVATWLNDMLKPKFNNPLTARQRASGDRIINELLSASETFTFSGSLNSRHMINTLDQGTDRVNLTFRSWGVYNMASDMDYYYLEQDAKVIVGQVGDSQIYYPQDAGEWYSAMGYDKYNMWYGSWLSQYITSMDLTGKGGTIKLEASAPGTNNDEVSTSIVKTSIDVETELYGLSVGAMLGTMIGFTLGGSYLNVSLDISAFSMSTRSAHYELSTKVNTDGNKVTWTHTAEEQGVPAFSMREDMVWNSHTGWGKVWYAEHSSPSAILRSDCSMSHDICWSVAKPTGQYTVNVTSAPQMAALMYSYSGFHNDPDPAHVYEYTTTPTEKFEHTLLQPNRFIQKWHMFISIDEWMDQPVTGAKTELEAMIKNQFSDIYATDFQIGTKTADDLEVINAIVNYSKNIFDQNADILYNLGKSLGIKKYSIYWRCNEMGIETQTPYEVKPVAMEIPGYEAQAIWCEGNTTFYFAYAPELKVGDTWDGQTVTNVWKGNDVSNLPNNVSPAWSSTVSGMATRVVFDESFANVRPKNCYEWFSQFEKLTTIEGIENLNTSEVTNTGWMFYKCSSLTTINVDGFDMSKVTKCRCMFYGCSNLETIYCSQTWNINTSSYMFYRCTELKGAIDFIFGEVESDMANPETGYFTYPDFAGTITLNEKSSNIPMLKRYEGKRVNVQYSRTLTAKIDDDGNYIAIPFTVSLPYDLDLTEAVGAGQVEIYTLAAVSESTGEFIFKKLDIKTLVAGTPYLLRIMKGSISLAANNVIISATTPKSSKVYTTVEEWRRGRGTDVGIWVANFDYLSSDDAADDDAFALQINDWRWDYYVHGGTAWIPAFRCYLSSSIKKKAYHSRFEQ